MCKTCMFCEISVFCPDAFNSDWFQNQSVSDQKLKFGAHRICKFGSLEIGFVEDLNAPDWFLQVAFHCSFEGILGVPRLAAPRGAVMGLQPGSHRSHKRCYHAIWTLLATISQASDLELALRQSFTDVLEKDAEVVVVAS